MKKREFLKNTLTVLASTALAGCSAASPSTRQATVAAAPTKPATKTPEPTATYTATKTPEPTATVILTKTPEPTGTVTATATVDAETAAIIKEIREKVGDKVSDWISYDTDPQPLLSDEPVNMYKVKFIYTGVAPEMENQEVFDGYGKSIGKVVLGINGVMLIDEKLQTLKIAYQILDGDTGYSVIMGGFRVLLGKYKHTEENTVGRKYSWNLVKGEVAITLLDAPETKMSDYEKEFNDFYKRFMAGKDKSYKAFIETGDTSIGMLLPHRYFMDCDANNKVRVPWMCKSKDKIIIETLSGV
jgi:hypothetical protein